MDYTSDPSTNQHPNRHDYEELALIYSHLDSATTVSSASAASKMPPAASPSQPLLPYAALQTSTRPLFGWQLFTLACPETIVVSSTLDLLQLEEVVFR